MRSARTRLLGAAAAAGLVAGGLAAGAAGPATAAVTAPIDCPEPFPVADAKDGVTGTGFTVEKGTRRDPFTATLLGRVSDGIAPGVDMIMADLASPALERAGGVWAGMSGSPVYTADGRLIGSVSYGLAASSPIAGITPAADMQKLLSGGTRATKVKVGAAAAKRIARTGEVSAKEAGEGFEVLKVPFTVSGMSGKRYDAFAKDIARRVPHALVRKGGTRVTGASEGSPSDIAAGSNFAAAVSYGAVTSGGVGTTTFVCRGEAVAFGHPMLQAGAVNLSAHPAQAVLVQPDPIFGPFKVANFGGVVGTVDQDRTTGIRARLGADPVSFPVTTTLSQDGGTAHRATTRIVYQPLAADLAGTHVMSLIDSLRESYGPGSGTFTTRITGKRAGGATFSLTLKDHVASTDDLSVEVAQQLYSTVAALVDQPYENIRLTGISVTGNVTDKVEQYRVTALRVADRKGRWVKPPATLRVSPGKAVKTRLTLTKYRSSQTRTVPLTVTAPAKAGSGDAGSLVVSTAGGPLLDVGEDFDDAQDAASTFPGLLKQLAAGPFSDQATATLGVESGTRTLTSATGKRLAFALSPYSRALDVEIK
jgi:hypothetical protein